MSKKMGKYAGIIEFGFEVKIKNQLNPEQLENLFAENRKEIKKTKKNYTG